MGVQFGDLENAFNEMQDKPIEVKKSELNHLIVALSKNNAFVERHPEFSGRLLNLLDETQAASQEVKSVTDLVNKNLLSKNQTLIHLAIQDKQPEKVKQLLSQGFPANSIDANGQTPLTKALAQGNDEISKILIESGKVDLDMPDSEGSPPLLHALKLGSDTGDFSILEKLLSSGANRDWQHPRNGNSLMHFVASSLPTDKVQPFGDIIKKYDLKMNIQNKRGETPLMIGSEKGRVKLSRLLLECDADQTLRSVDGHTALHLAAAGNKKESVKLLLGSDNPPLHIKDNAGFAPIHYAIMNGGGASWKLLLDADSDIEALGADTLLLEAIQGSDPECFFELLDAGVKIDYDSPEAEKLMARATELGLTPIVDHFISNGTHVDSKNAQGKTALMLFASKNDSDLISKLTAKGASVDAKDSYGLTPLMHAALHASTESMLLLIKSGADPYIEDPRGLTFFHYLFIEAPSIEVLEALRDAGVDFEPFAKAIPNLEQAVSDYEIFTTGEQETISLLETVKRDPVTLADRDLARVIRESVRQKLHLELKDAFKEPVDATILQESKELQAKIQNAPLLPLSDIETQSKDAYGTFLELRMQGSTSMTSTVHSTSQEIDLARNKWIETDLFLRQAALNKEPITKEFLCELNRKVNLGGKNPGELRSKDDEVTGGDATLYNTYLYGEFINESIDEFISWLDRQFSLCDKREADPIELAASTYQRLVSLHPFADANGRTTRALMDYILQRYDLPPAALGQNVKVAIFPLISEKINFLPRKALTPNDAVKLIINGVRKSYEILSQR